MIDNRLKKERFRKDAMEKGKDMKREKSGDRDRSKSVEKKWEKGGEKNSYRGTDKKWEKSGDKNRDKSVEKRWEKGGDKDRYRSSENKWEKSGDKNSGRGFENKWEKSGDKNRDKTVEKRWEKGGDKDRYRSSENKWERSTDKNNSEKRFENKRENSGDKNRDKTVEKRWEKGGDKDRYRGVDKKWEKSGDKNGGKRYENKWENSGDKNRDKSVEKGWEKSGDRDRYRGAEKKWDKSGDTNSGKRFEKKWEKSGDKNSYKRVEKNWENSGDKNRDKENNKYREKGNGKVAEKFKDSSLESNWDKSNVRYKERDTERNKDNSRDYSKSRGKEQKRDYREKDNSYGKERFEKENRGNSARHENSNVRKEGKARNSGKSSSKCPVFQKCGGCQLLDMPYEKQLEQKQKQLEELLKPYCHVEPIIGMKNPYYYRNKVHAVFDFEKGNAISGVYEANSHRVVPVEKCMIEDQKSDEIIGTIRGMLKSFKIRTYNEDTGYGLLRHVLIRRGFATGEIMVVLVTASPVFPSKNNFVKALREKHPEITTVIQNINNRDTSMVLGDKEHVLYGKGFIEDVLCGCRFRISSKSFYQVNPVQTEVLYKKAIEAAGLTGKERVIDAYCGIGTIGIVASSHAKEVIGVELNRDAVRDAVENAKINGVKNARFFCNDAGKFMVNMAENGEHVDVVFMDPPRSGSTEEFIESVAKLKPEKVVYVSCGPETLARDLEYFRKMGYEAKKGWGVDLFPATEHTEIIVEMCRNKA